MHDTLAELIANIQQARKEVKEYKGQMADWKKTEYAISLKERNEQQANTKRYISSTSDNGYNPTSSNRVEEEIKRAFSLQDIENYRLKQQISNLAFDKTHMQQQHVDLEKKYKELEFVIGQEDAPEFAQVPADPQ